MRSGYAPIPEPRPRLAWRSVAIAALLLGALAGVSREARRRDAPALASSAAEAAAASPMAAPSPRIARSGMNGGGGGSDDNKSGGSDDDNKSGGSDDDNKSGGSDDDNKSGGSDDDNKSGGSDDDKPAPPAADPDTSGAMAIGVAIGLGCAVVLYIAALVAYKLLLRRRTKQPRNTFTDGGIVLSPWSAEHNYAPPAQEDALGGGLNL